MPPAELPPNSTVRRHLESGTLESRASDGDEVAAFWRKALIAYEDARQATASLESRVLRAYDAGRIAAFALVRAAGYRTRGAEGHHYVTFDVARSLAEQADLRTALDEMSGLRALRHSIEYEPDDDVTAAAAATAIAIAARIINGGAEHLWSLHPALKARIRKVRAASSPLADDYPGERA